MKEKEAPKHIYLQINDPETGEELPREEITWCENRQHETDIVYVNFNYFSEALESE